MDNNNNYLLTRIALGIHYARKDARPTGVGNFVISKHMERVKDLFEYLRPIADAFIYSDKTDVQNYRHEFHILYAPKYQDNDDETILTTYTSMYKLRQRDTSIEYKGRKNYGISCSIDIAGELMIISIVYGLDKFSTTIDLSFIDYKAIIDKYFDYGQKKLFNLLKDITSTHEEYKDYHLHELGISIIVKKSNFDRLKDMFDEDEFDIGDVIFLDFKDIKLYRNASMP